MKTDNTVLEKSKKFAIKIVRLTQQLREIKNEHLLSRQLLKSGTSIGANVREAHSSMSKAEFKAKLNIALKEASETEYWLEVLKETDYLTDEQFECVYKDCNELNKLLISIIKTLNA